MAAHRQLETAPQGMAVNRGDDRLLALLHYRDICGIEWLLAFALEFGDIGAGDEAASSTDQHDGGGGRIGDGGFECRFERGTQRVAGGVDRRIVDGEQRDIADLLDFYQRQARGHC